MTVPTELLISMLSIQSVSIPQQTAFQDDPASGEETLEMAEEKAIRAAIARYTGNLSLVAKSLNISRPTLYAKLKKYNI